VQGCSVIGAGATIIAAGVSYDAILQETKFVPLLAEGYKAIFGTKLPMITTTSSTPYVTEV